MYGMTYIHLLILFQILFYLKAMPIEYFRSNLIEIKQNKNRNSSLHTLIIFSLTKVFNLLMNSYLNYLIRY